MDNWIDRKKEILWRSVDKWIVRQTNRLMDRYIDRQNW